MYDLPTVPVGVDLTEFLRENLESGQRELRAGDGEPGSLLLFGLG